MTCGTLVMGLFIIPFFIEQPMFFLGIPAGYEGAIDKFWRLNQYSLLGKRNLGLAFVFGYDWRNLMGIIGKVLMIIVPGIWIGAYLFLKRKHNIKTGIWAMAGLKLLLVIFYNFISMPFLYIFLVPTLVSYPLLLGIIKDSEN